MSFSIVPTVANGDSWSAAQHNTYLRDNMSALWPYTTLGDLVYASSANALARLPIGSEYKFLQVNSSGNAPQWGGLHSCSLYHNTTQTISNNTTTALTFNSETDDAQGWHSTSVNPTRITVSQTGDYIAGWSFNYAGAGGTGTYYDYMEIQLNGVAVHIEIHHGLPIDASTKFYAGSTRKIRATAGSYFECCPTQRSGGTRTVSSGAAFTLVRVG